MTIDYDLYISTMMTMIVAIVVFHLLVLEVHHTRVAIDVVVVVAHDDVSIYHHSF